jgi:hypothetical protein
MNITGFRGLRGSVTLEGLTQVVIYDDLGQPIFIVSSPAPGIAVYVAAGDEEFSKLLSELKISAKAPRVVDA